MRPSIGSWQSAIFRWAPWPTPNTAAWRPPFSIKNWPGSTSSPAAKCTAARTTGTLRRTRCCRRSAFQGGTRPKPITKKDPDVFHPAATCKDRIHDNIDLGLVDEFRQASALTRKPVKITMTGPHMLAAVAYDEYYGDISKMMLDLAKLLRRNFRTLVDAGCRHIQIDEPLFSDAADAEVQAAADSINLAIADIPEDVHVSVHVCQGNYAVGKEYDGQIGHRYFDSGRYKADLICKIECSS